MKTQKGQPTPLDKGSHLIIFRTEMTERFLIELIQRRAYDTNIHIHTQSKKFQQQKNVQSKCFNEKIEMLFSEQVMDWH